jgi:hypothetical protein
MPVRAWIVLCTAVGALAIAACGSSGNAGTAALSDNSAPLRFATCMRAHGVPTFPDPSASGQIAISLALAQSPAFQTAQQACKKFAPKGGAPQSMSASQRRAALAFAECMRAHGQPDFPDPILSANGAPRVLALRGMLFALGPGMDPKSPAFRQAATACGVRAAGRA